MPLVEITLVEGRSLDQKRALLAAVTEAVERSVGAPRETIRTVLREIPPEYWAIGGVSILDRRAEAESRDAASGKGGA